MMRRLLLLLLAVGLCHIVYAQIHCALEATDCSEGSCELCHLSDQTPLTGSAVLLFSPTPTVAYRVPPSPRKSVVSPLNRNRGRAPPR